MNKTQIYLKAAKLIYEDKETFSCIAVRRASGKKESCYFNSEAIFYESVFRDDFSTRFQIQIANSRGNLQELRVMLLCMMAACWRDFV